MLLHRINSFIILQNLHDIDFYKRHVVRKQNIMRTYMRYNTKPTSTRYYFWQHSTFNMFIIANILVILVSEALFVKLHGTSLPEIAHHRSIWWRGKAGGGGGGNKILIWKLEYQVSRPVGNSVFSQNASIQQYFVTCMQTRNFTRQWSWTVLIKLDFRHLFFYS